MNAFDRYRPAMAAFFAAPLVMALIFGSVVIKGGSPVRPEFYGPIVYAIPALGWVTMQVVLSGAAMIGFAWGRPRLAAGSAFFLGALFEFFAAAAIVAGASGTLLVAMAVPTGALSVVCASVAWQGRNGTK
jgi:low affinity Fe/Cu permease